MGVTLVADVGSITTVVNAFNGLDSENPEFIAQGFAPTSVGAGDVLIGLNRALRQLKANLGQELKYDEFFATSSAAGGLKMTVHGSGNDLTDKAAREAAFGAGAIVRYTTTGIISETDLKQIAVINPDIILLSGGTAADKAVVLANAKALSEALSRTRLKASVIFAGHVAAGDEVEQVFSHAGITLYRGENVHPSRNSLRVDPIRRVIQRVFEQHLTETSGMRRIREVIQGRIMLTSGALLTAAERLYAEIGDLMIVDVGGSKTEVYSVSEGNEAISRILLSPEPLAKRTVEEDLGVYVNTSRLCELIGNQSLQARYGVEYQNLIRPVPESVLEFTLSRELTAKAVETAVKRHAGKLVNGDGGKAVYAVGKDLTAVKWVIGTGGALTRLPGGTEIMASVTGEKKNALIPRQGAAVLLDNYYVFAALGVLAALHPTGAAYLMRESMGIER